MSLIQQFSRAAVSLLLAASVVGTATTPSSSTTASSVFTLENGVSISIPSGTYRSGDYWTFCVVCR